MDTLVSDYIECGQCGCRQAHYQDLDTGLVYVDIFYIVCDVYSVICADCGAVLSTFERVEPIKYH